MVLGDVIDIHTSERLVVGSRFGPALQRADTPRLVFSPDKKCGCSNQVGGRKISKGKLRGHTLSLTFWFNQKGCAMMLLPETIAHPIVNAPRLPEMQSQMQSHFFWSAVTR